jgi:hypothetical protein
MTASPALARISRSSPSELDNLMAHESYWQRRLTDVTLKAAATGNERLRAVYLDLAAHYVSMSELCTARAPTRPREAQTRMHDLTTRQTGTP